MRRTLQNGDKAILVLLSLAAGGLLWGVFAAPTPTDVSDTEGLCGNLALWFVGLSVGICSVILLLVNRTRSWEYLATAALLGSIIINVLTEYALADWVSLQVPDTLQSTSYLFAFGMTWIGIAGLLSLIGRVVSRGTY